jgi:predicted negative regulator of RcsB-dependent stress response
MESDVTQSALYYQLYAWFDAHKKQVAWGIAAVMAIGLIAGFVYWRGNAKQENANMALSQLISQGWASGQPQPPENFLKVVADHPGTDAAGRALLMAAAGFFHDGKYSDSEAQCKRFLSEFHGTPLSGQALFGIAASLDAAGKVDDAAAAYKDIIDHHSSENVGLPSKLALGGLYEGQGKFAQARDLYQQVASEGANSFEQARRYYLQERFVRGGVGTLGSEAVLRLEDLIAKHPELAITPKPAPMQPALTIPSISTKASTNVSTNVPQLKLQTP